MPRASVTRDVLAPPMSLTRIFVALTLAEGAALAQLAPGANQDARQAFAKIHAAVEGARAALREPPLLRAKAYKPSAPPVSPPPPARAPRRRPLTSSTPRPAAADDYVPYRDEAGGLWK